MNNFADFYFSLRVIPTVLETCVCECVTVPSTAVAESTKVAKVVTEHFVTRQATTGS